ncbi:MAG: prephenate dehydrogenase [Candidatus Saccharicenans sp.]
MNSDFFIVGLGQIGGSLALALKEKKIARKVYGLDIRYRREYSNLLDGYVSELEEGVKKADFIVLCTPVDEIKKQVEVIGPLMKGSQILFDTGSTKKEIVKKMEKFPDRLMVGGHPMAGTVKEGKNSWNAELFSGKPFFLCEPQTGSKKKSLKKVREVIEKLGAIPVKVRADFHDRAVALTSQLPYFLSLVLFSLYLKKRTQSKDIDDFVATGFLGATRLCLTPKAMGQSMLMSNLENMIGLARDFIKEFEDWQDLLKKGRLEERLSFIRKEADKRRKLYEKAFPQN